MQVCQFQLRIVCNVLNVCFFLKDNALIFQLFFLGVKKKQLLGIGHVILDINKVAE